MTRAPLPPQDPLDEFKKIVWECIRYNKFNLSDTETVESIVEAATKLLRDKQTEAKIATLRSIDCIVYDPVDLEKYLDERIEVELRTRREDD